MAAAKSAVWRKDLSVFDLKNGFYANNYTCTPYAFDKKTPNFAQGLDFLRFQVAIYSVFHEESESEVKKRILFKSQEGKIGKVKLIPRFLISYFFIITRDHGDL